MIDTLGNVSWIDNLSLIDTLIKKGGGQNIPTGMLETVMVPKCLISKCISWMKNGVDGSWKKNLGD